MENQPTKTKKLPKLTKKQREFVDRYVATGNGQESALKVYDIESKDPENVARSIATENLTKPAIIAAVEIQRESLKSALEKEGVTPVKIAKTINELLDGRDKDGNHDFTAKDKGLKHALNIHGVEDQNDKPRSQNTYNFIFSPEVQADVKALEQTLKAKLIEKHEPQTS